MKDLLINILPEQISRSIKKLYLMGRRWYYIGSKYKCPICDNSFRKMLPGGFDHEVVKKLNIIGSGRRDNDVCPYCQSTDRDRLVFLYLKQETNVFKQKVKILHVGPEPSLYGIFKKHKNILYVTGTKYSEGIYYPKNIDSIDLLELSFGDSEFDMVICNHILEHIDDDHKAISEIYRVLTPGGSAILQVPLSNELEVTYEDTSIKSEKLREVHFGQFDHVRIYGKDYGSKLESVGFEVEKYQPSYENPNKRELNLFALNKNEKLFIAHKNL